MTSQMTTLASAIARLFETFSFDQDKFGHDVRVVEFDLRLQGTEPLPWSVPRDRLYEVEEYSKRFAELQAIGMPWINISLYGRCGEFVVVGVEMRSRDNDVSVVRRSTVTSINMSGPTRRTIESDWDASAELTIE